MRRFHWNRCPWIAILLLPFLLGNVDNTKAQIVDSDTAEVKLVVRKMPEEQGPSAEVPEPQYVTVIVDPDPVWNIKVTALPNTGVALDQESKETFGHLLAMGMIVAGCGAVLRGDGEQPGRRASCAREGAKVW
jgi:hypothetical protein